MFSALGSILGSIGSVGASVGLPLYMMNRQNSMNMRNSYELTAYQYELQKKFQKYLDVDRPSAVMEGYRRAGVNPLLAVGSLGNPVGGASVANGVGVNAPHVDVAGSARAGAMLFEQLKSMRLANKGAKLENKSTELQNDILRNEAFASNEESAARAIRAHVQSLEDTARQTAIHDNDADYQRNVGRAYLNAFERQRYLNSKEHAMAEDFGNSAKSAVQAIVDLKSIKGGLKKSWKRP